MAAASLTVRAYAKVNLDLRIVGLLPDGYHDVRTVLQSLRLHDTLTFTPGARPVRHRVRRPGDSHRPSQPDLARRRSARARRGAAPEGARRDAGPARQADPVAGRPGRRQRRCGRDAGRAHQAVGAEARPDGSVVAGRAAGRRRAVFPGRRHRARDSAVATTSRRSPSRRAPPSSSRCRRSAWPRRTPMPGSISTARRARRPTRPAASLHSWPTWAVQAEQRSGGAGGAAIPGHWAAGAGADRARRGSRGDDRQRIGACSACSSTRPPPPGPRPRWLTAASPRCTPPHVRVRRWPESTAGCLPQAERLVYT